MAKAKLSPMFDELSGSYGDIVYRERNGTTVLAHRPKKKAGVVHPVHAAFTEQALRARDYARRVKADAATLALYEQAAEETGKSVYKLCREDYFNAPVVTSVNPANYEGQVGDPIRIIARDDFGVVEVRVTLADDDEGTLIEKGRAVHETANTGDWVYTATKPVPAGVTVSMRVEAYDRPGNVGTMQGTKRVQPG